MSESNGGNGGSGSSTIIGTFKAILQSPVGGWVVALLGFAALSYWIIQDRAVIYHDMRTLRNEAMPLIKDTKFLAERNQKAIEEANSITVDNNRILQEIRSMMNLPMANQRTLEDIQKRLKQHQETP